MAVTQTLSHGGDHVAAALQAVGERLLTLFLDPTIVGFYRSAAAELERFPELGQLLFDRGPAAMYAVLTDYLGRWVEHGALRIADLRTAAVHFVTLCHGDLVVRSQLGVLPEPRGHAIVLIIVAIISGASIYSGADSAPGSWPGRPAASILAHRAFPATWAISA